MNVFKYCWKHSFLGLFVNMISERIDYRKDMNFISDTLYSDAFRLVLKNYLKADFKKDWIGRLYGVVNPNLDENGKYDFNNIIIEIDGDNTNNNEYVKNWVYKQMKLIGSLFKIERLYDYINIDFKHVGPENMDNYLVIFDVVSRQSSVLAIKKFFKRLFILCLIGIIVFLSFKFIII